MNTDRNLLLKELADLLGFEDGAADVLDHLLTIESGKDLKDYLSQLLGSGDERIEKLADNVALFQKGQRIVLDTQTNGNTDVKKKAEPDYGPRKQTKSKTPPRQRQKQQQQRPSSRTPPRQKQTFSTKVTGGATLTPTKTRHNPTPAELAAQAKPSAAEATTKASVTKKAQKSRPKRGKAKVQCGCFGSFHKPLTNCLFCGRISCEKEGYDYCNFCGYMIERVVGGTDAASKHKERLLRFDREYAKRTVVLDDQADHFTNHQSLNWMGQEEREEALAQEKERSKTERNPKMQLNLAL